ncbi:ABC transporter ATP-binding protein [Bacillus velezensis]|uniref:ABC transporter ATP-binding protein n=1 Tax=Bacillus velezensis TaxID=492670 RepID=UPI002DBD4CBD|nr:ABC transporter ATP-binding protein [Bacillus velezensis]MEC3658858.1 ABC transporter ATP-binding protein [Bacillus velezensis]MEC3684628.1 ABC transporter ATP-binding protein [Bacillus velezensis]MEC3787579.1 ABC transporter ATP-binding protein [Bacillus velezensis]MEC3846841.1 ABC transporter ATP-binding protein [Bacillus velezensis]
MITMLNVTKKIKKKLILDNISYSFEKGKIYGLFGENGSGKTMLLRTLAGLLVPTHGSITINGEQLHKNISFPKSVGIIIEHMQLLPQYNAVTNLKILSKIKKIASNEDIEDTIKRVGLDPSSNLKVKKYSLGMKQRLNIAQAIFEKPEILLLDEPTNAIDEKGISLIHEIILEEKKRGTTIIIASHHKEDVLSLCDYTLTIEKGKLYNDLH